MRERDREKERERESERETVVALVVTVINPDLISKGKDHEGSVHGFDLDVPVHDLQNVTECLAAYCDLTEGGWERKRENRIRVGWLDEV